jgi:hypothetical protein
MMQHFLREQINFYQGVSNNNDHDNEGDDVK